MRRVVWLILLLVVGVAGLAGARRLVPAVHPTCAGRLPLAERQRALVRWLGGYLQGKGLAEALAGSRKRVPECVRLVQMVGVDGFLAHAQWGEDGYPGAFAWLRAGQWSVHSVLFSEQLIGYPEGGAVV